jgi:RimJ/RimL family protein N-acetyltransferase
VAVLAPGVKNRDSGRFDVDVVYLAIEVDGLLVGEVDVRRVAGLSSDAFEVGIELYDEGRRGKGLGGEAFGLVVSYLIESRSATRVEASTSLDNTSIGRILEKRGFNCAGESTSHVQYVCMRREWQKRKGD